MAAITAKRLASGTLAATKGTIYTVPATKLTRVKSIIFYNSSSVNYNTTTLYLKNDSGTSKKIAVQTLKPNSTWVYQLEHAIVLEDADLIEGDATNASQVYYYISGGESGVPGSGIVPKHISDGDLTASYTYTVPSGRAFYLYNLILFSTNGNTASPNQLDLSINTTSIMSIMMRENEYFVVDFPIILSSTDQFNLTGTSGIVYWLDGAEEIP